jgi:hypothetical protein
MTDRTTAQGLRPKPEGLVFEQISYIYVAANGTTPVLKSVSFSVEPGQVACVVEALQCLGVETNLSGD